MVYEFTYQGRVYDTASTSELPTAYAVEKHKKEVQEKYDLPYVRVQERCL